MLLMNFVIQYIFIWKLKHVRIGEVISIIQGSHASWKVPESPGFFL